MQEHINDLNSRAYRDQLTNVRNKAAYEIYLRELDAELQSAPPEKEGEESSGVAICMFDCNELKYINDMYGHARGDVYLRNCCELICQVFSHSPVFRIGGDEFLAVLKDGDFLQREKLLREFQTWMDRRADAANPWERVSVAFGLAIYNAAYDRSLEDTVRRSDRTMYQNKRKMKSRRV
jgi:diguanylate cyclase (GGDEF)-like protein